MGDPAGRRLMIKEMILENFKSYAGAQRVGPFHKNFSAVVGPNGSGKSNVIDAMLFVFGRRAKQLRFNKVSELIHNSTHHRNLDMARVQVFFQEIIDKDGDGYEVIPGSEFVVSRTAHRDNKSEYFVNERKMTAKEVTTMLKEQGIDLDNNRFLILQGEVEQISLMKPKGEDKNDVGFLEYLEDIIGTDRYKPMIEDAAKNLEELTEQRTMMAQKVKGVEKELQGLEGSKKEAEEYLKAAAELQQTIIKGNSLKIRQVEMRTKESTERIADLKQQLEVAVKEKDGCSATFKESQAKLKALEKEQGRAQAAVEAAEKHFKDLERQDAKNLEDRKHLSQKIKKLAAKVVSDTKALEKVKSESVNMDDKVPRLQEELEETTLQLQEAEQKVQQLTDSLKPQVQALNQEASAVRLDLAPWEAQMQQVRSRLEVAESEHRVLLKKQEDAQQRVVDTEAALQAAVTANKEQHQAKEQLQQRLAQSRARLADMQRGQANCAANEERLDGIVREMRRKVDGMRHEINSQKSASQAITALMEAKARGEIPGFLGRLGDLGAIDAKYDIAVSTAVGALDYLVVETAVDGQKGVELLRRNNLGIATFLILEKQQHLTAAANQNVQTPEGVPRLFDLVKTQDKKLKVAFYFAMGNMVVANDLEQAKRIGYGRDRKFASVVTLQGQLISQSGTMTGGGSKPRGGRMRLGSSAPRNIDSSQAAKELATAEEQLARSVQELDAARAATADAVQQVKQLEKQTSTLEMDIPKAEMRAKAEEAKAKDLQKQLSKLQNSTKVDAEESQRIAALTQSIATDQGQLQQLQGSCQGLKQKLQVILDKIQNVGGKKMKAAKDAVEGLRGVIAQLEQEVTNKTVKSQTNRKQIEKLDKDITKNETEKGKVEQQLKELEQAIKNLEEDAINAEGNKQKCEAELKKAQAALEEGRVKHEEEQEQFNSIHQKIEAFKDEIKELQRGLKDEDKALAVARDKVKQAQAKLQELEVDVEMLDEALYEGTDEDLTKRIMDFANQTVNREQVLQRMNGDLTALHTYKAKEAELGTKTQELQTVTQRRDEVRKEYENLRKKRLDEFMAGFNIISLRLKEMYQMITLGGDAELELVDSLDPFSEGIVFSVRPPKKSWKCIANLSGGEKTLSSLSLVFALHHFKPTPLYVMDEIDAALDFRNVSIVGHYIKERTRNAQFVIISLRNNMFELADRMVGIYKTDNCTKSVCVNPGKFNLRAAPQSRTQTTQQSNDENMQQPAAIPVV